MDNKAILNNTLELRPFQGMSYNYGFSDQWNVNIYGRVEERFDFDTQTWESQNSIRLRLRLRTAYTWDTLGDNRYYKVLLGVEAFKTVRGEVSQLNEQSRLTLGVERNFNKNQRVRLEVTLQQQTLFTIKDKTYSDVYFRIRYYPSVGDSLINKWRNRD